MNAAVCARAQTAVFFDKNVKKRKKFGDVAILTGVICYNNNT